WLYGLWIGLAALACPGLSVLAWISFRGELEKARAVREAVMRRHDLTWEKIRQQAARQREEAARLRREEARRREEDRRRAAAERAERERQWREDYRRAVSEYRCPYCGRNLHYLHERVDGRRDMRYNFNPLMCYSCRRQY